MAIVTVATSKGGVGKSTVSINLAIEAVHSGLNVLLVDADTQGTALEFRGVREDMRGSAAAVPELTVIPITKKTLHNDVKKLQGFDLIVIDAGGRDSATFRSAISAAEPGIIIPVQPSQMDLWATENTLSIIDEFKPILPYLQPRLLLNQVNPNTSLPQEMLSALSDFDVPLFDIKLGSRVAWRRSISEGMGVREFEPNGKAAEESRNLWQEVKRLWL